MRLLAAACFVLPLAGCTPPSDPETWRATPAPSAVPAPPLASPTASVRPALVAPSPSPSPPVVFERRPSLRWDFEQGPKTFGDAAVVRGEGFPPGRYTLWIGPPRAGVPSCVPEDAVALETITVDARGAFAHGFTVRESWGTWKLRRNDFFRLYAAPEGGACPEAGEVAVLPVALADHRANVEVGGYGPCAPDRVGETYREGQIANFFAPAEARQGEPVHVVVRLELFDSCVRPCAEALQAVVDEATRTVTLEAATFRPVPQSCLGVGSTADLETSFTPASSGVYTLRARIPGTSYGGGSREHLALASPERDGTDVVEATLPVVVRARTP